MGNTIEQSLLELERSYWQAMKDRDGATATRLTDETCIVAGSRGVATTAKSKIASMVSSDSYKVEGFEITDPQVRMLSDDVAILAYNVHEDLTVDGRSISLEASDASTWIRRDGNWVCAMHTESVHGDPFRRDRASA